ncbi:MAG: SIMPL domain-containing protein [Patescibacteria group bacterium]|nr:SIMPL domain-containing protein [Patescibacteria group bacterium]
MNNTIWPKWPEQKLFFVLVGIFMAYAIIWTATGIQSNLEEFNNIGKAPRERDVIVIDGQGDVSGTPDIAVVDVGMVSEAAAVIDAQNSNTEKMNKLVSELKKMGIDSKDLQTANYSIYPKYNYSEGRSDIVGYTVNQSVEVKIRDMEKISLVLAAVGRSGANQVSGVQFGIDDSDQLNEEARIEALADAKTKAINIAKALGVNIVRVVGFTESSAMPSSIAYSKMAEDMGGGDMPQIESGTLDVVSNVTVTFEIE